MKTTDGAFHQCYNGQAVVDARTQVIVAAELSDQAPDARQLEPALDQLDENLDAIGAELPDGATLSADAGYFSERQRQDHHRARPRPAHRDRPLQALRAAAARAARTDPERRDSEAADGAQAANEERPRRLRAAAKRSSSPSSARSTPSRTPASCCYAGSRPPATSGASTARSTTCSSSTGQAASP